MNEFDLMNYGNLLIGSPLSIVYFLVFLHVAYRPDADKERVWWTGVDDGKLWGQESVGASSCSFSKVKCSCLGKLSFSC